MSKTTSLKEQLSHEQTEALKERIGRRTVIIENGCWEWQGATTNGYAKIWNPYEKRQWNGHRLTYTLYRGGIPDGLVIDHLCRNRTCLNPLHMETVSNGENVMRGIGITAMNARKTACKRGHPLSGYNIVWEGHKRSCRKCCNANWHRYNLKKKAKAVEQLNHPKGSKGVETDD